MSLPLGINVLNFGKLLTEEDSKRSADKNPKAIEAAEESLISELCDRTNKPANNAFNCGGNKGLPDSLSVRIIAVVAFLQLASSRSRSSINLGEVAKIVSQGQVETVIAARQAIVSLLISKQLVLEECTDCLVRLGKPLMAFFAGGAAALPLQISEEELQERRRKLDAQSTKRLAKTVAAQCPSAKTLAERIASRVVGLEPQVQTLACRLPLIFWLTRSRSRLNW